MLRRNGKNLSLVGDLHSSRFPDNVRNLFSLSAITNSEERPRLLFTPKHPLIARDRQNYTQWKNFIQMNYLYRRNITSWKKVKAISFLSLGNYPQFVLDWRLESLGLFEVLARFLEDYFLGFSIDIVRSQTFLETANCVTRCHPVTRTRQILAPDLLEKISQRGKFTTAISWSDLYPSEDLNFVLGQASFERSSAVISFGRYEAAKTDGDVTAIDGRILRRLCQALAHETCHVFGLSHCVFFECLMNDSTSLNEAEDQPLHLCPVCLRKLQKVCGFDVELRYVKLKQFFSEIDRVLLTGHFSRTVDWLENCLCFLNSGKKG